MKSIGCPSPAELLHNEYSTLKFLSQDSQSYIQYHELAIQAKKRYKKPPYRSLSFESYMDVNPWGREYRIIIGVCINSSTEDLYSNVSYCMSITEKCPLRILRKFHFDYAPPEIVRDDPHPKSHLQYGGELTPSMRNLGFKDEDINHMIPDLSNPRIPSTPICLALLIHLALKEFNDRKAHAFIERREWRKIIRKNEIFLLRNYHEKCYQFLSTGGEDGKPLFDLFYGE